MDVLEAVPSRFRTRRRKCREFASKVNQDNVFPVVHEDIVWLQVAVPCPVAEQEDDSVDKLTEPTEKLARCQSILTLSKAGRVEVQVAVFVEWQEKGAHPLIGRGNRDKHGGRRDYVRVATGQLQQVLGLGEVICGSGWVDGSFGHKLSAVIQHESSVGTEEESRGEESSQIC